MIGFQLDKTDHVEDVIYSRKQQSGDPAPQTNNDLFGNSVWGIIAGKELQLLYEMMFSSVRSSKKEIVVPYRCDFPIMQRFMELRIIAVRDDTLFVLNFLNAEEDTAYTALLDQVERDPNDSLSICSWCKKVELEHEWVEIQVAIHDLGLFASSQLQELTHGVCPNCVTTIMDAAAD
jgi:hypothetical protein